MESTAVIWLYGMPENRAKAAELRQTLERMARCLLLGVPGDPAPDLDLGPEPDLALALLACPAELRPSALVALDGPDDSSADLMPCPVIAWDGGVEPTVESVQKAMADGPALPWLDHVQVNMPLRDLLGPYRDLAQGNLVNMEIGFDSIALDSLGPERIAEAKALMAGRRITAHLPFFDLVPASADPLVAAVAGKRLGQAAELAVEFGAVQAVGHLGYSEVMHRDLDAFSALYAKALAPIAQTLDRGGCRLCLENTLELFIPPLLECRRALADKAGLAVGFCLDTGHAVSFSRASLQEWWRAFAPDIWEMHLHDNDGSDDLHNPPGSGIVDWSFIKRSLAELHQPPIFTLEPHNEAKFYASLRGLERVWGKPGS